MRHSARPAPLPERWNALPEQIAATTSATYRVLVVARHFRLERTDRESGERTYKHGAAQHGADVYETARAMVRASWPLEFLAPPAAAE